MKLLGITVSTVAALQCGAPIMAQEFIAPAVGLHNSETASARIRALFRDIDEMNFRALREGERIEYFTDEDGRVDLGTFLLRTNFRDGREDAEPIEILNVKQVGASDSARACYGVIASRSVWYERSSPEASGYSSVPDHWLGQ